MHRTLVALDKNGDIKNMTLIALEIVFASLCMGLSVGIAFILLCASESAERTIFCEEFTHKRVN